ncbi:MAG TPA: methyltransferase [Pyrinomonadaceae bacterium]|jgi:SAM-dependent methyltransferase
MSETLSAVFPLRFGSADDFRRVESMLREAGFTEENVCRILGMDDMSDLSRAEAEGIDLSGVDERLALFIRFFLLTETLPRFVIECAFEQQELDAMQALDLVRLVEYDEQLCYSPVFLYPVAGLLVASDRYTTPEGTIVEEAPDIVFPAIDEGALLFLRIISKSPARDALDLGTGSGAAALLLSPSAGQVTASDITPRSAHFARFNALLNRCANVEVVEGDMYEPVRGRSFERIVSHPPYVPAFGETVIYRDGGDTGERLLRRVVEGLPEHLRAGGTFYAICMGQDTSQGKFEERVRGWLGETEREFDVLFGLGDTKSVKRFLAQMLLRRGAEQSHYETLEQTLERAGTRRLIYGALVIHRRAPGVQSEPLTARPDILKETTGASFDWALRWHRRRSRADFFDALAQSRPRPAPALQVEITHGVREGELVVRDLLFRSDFPFPALTRVEPWILSLVLKLRGEQTLTEVYETSRAAEVIPEAFALEDFLQLTATLVERGYLAVDDSFPES